MGSTGEKEKNKATRQSERTLDEVLRERRTLNDVLPSEWEQAFENHMKRMKQDANRKRKS